MQGVSRNRDNGETCEEERQEKAAEADGDIQRDQEQGDRLRQTIHWDCDRCHPHKETCERHRKECRGTD